MSDRVSKIVGHLKPNSSPDDEIVIVDVLRTPIGRKNGYYKSLQVADLAAIVMKEIITRNKFPTADLCDIACGNVLSKAVATHVRIGALMAGIPNSVPIYAVNRQCSSGSQALMNAIDSIRNNNGEVALAVGVESMTNGDMMDVGEISKYVYLDKEASTCLIGMGETSDNVAKLGVSRQAQDTYAVESHKKAYEATKAKKFNEIIPVTVDGKTYTEDEGIKPATTVEKLAALKPAFTPTGTTTAGNSSQVSDGAAAALVCTRRYAKKHNLKPIARVVGFGVAGCEPKVMGTGPVYAIPKALENAGLTINDIDVFEINEAFASQFLYSANKLNIPANKINPQGGAIAIGHPLGATGLRMTGTLLNQLKNNKQRYGLVSMCIGTGMGMCTVLENLDL